MKSKYATLSKDVELNGYGVISAGQKYEIITQNSRYTYLQIKTGLNAQICNSCLVGYKPKTRAKKKTDKINLLDLL